MKRTVDWAASTAPSLAPALRAELAALWRARMISEHRSVGIFAQYTLDLLAVGAPSDVVELSCRAALDETRHAALFALVAALYSGQKEVPPAGIAPMADDASVPLRHQVAREALHLSVFAETYSSVLLQEIHDRARDPVVRQVIGIVLGDEVQHARMGWSYLATLLDDDLRAFLQSDVRPMIDDFERSTFGDPVPAMSDPAIAEAHGYLSPTDEHRLFRATIDEVWRPGLERLGIRL